MTIVVALILGAVQGLTEFLPVSSSGHLLLLEQLFGIEGNQMLFNIVVHIATLLAVVIVFRKTVWELIKKPFSTFSILLIVSTVITVSFVLVFENLLEKTFSGSFLGFAFLITAAVLTATTLLQKKIKQKDIDIKAAITMGLVQGIAAIPGISRSGSTICSGILAGGSKEQVAQFSFLLSIPIILASLVYELLKGGSLTGVGFAPTVVAFISSFVFGIIAIKFMLKVIKRANYVWFALYLVFIAAVAFVVI